MRIRPAQPSDLPVINDIYNQAVRQRFCTAHLEPVELNERKRWFGTHPQSHFPVFVLERNSEVAGWVSLGPYRQDRQALSHVAEVSYYVDEKMRRRGIGSRLLEHAIQEAPAFGFSVLVAILLNKNPSSISLLEKYGFKCWGVMPGIAHIDGQEADHLYYGLKL